MNTCKCVFLCLVFLLSLLSAYPAAVFYTDIEMPVGTAASIKRVNADGSGLTNLINGLQHPRGMTLDAAGGKMYWTEPGLQAIRRANLDGTGVETVVATGSDSGGGVALDLVAGKIYWSAGFPSGVIRRANLDGTTQEDLVTNGLIHPVGIALNIQQGKIYWTDLQGHRDGTGKIQRSNLDGSSVETLLTEIDEATGLAVDAVSGKIYWPEAVTKKIQRANLDGTGIEDLVTGLGNPTTVGIDLTQLKIYWTDSDSNGQTNLVQRANLDGSNVETVVSGVGFPWGIAVAPAPRLKIKKAVYPDSDSLTAGLLYQLQVSADMNTWTNHGASFTATNSIWRSTDHWDVDDWNKLFFRLQSQ